MYYFSMALFVLWTALLVSILEIVLGEVPVSYPASGMVSNSITTSPAGKYVHQYTAPYRESPSYGVQTGYEGYLIPAPLADTTGSEEEGGFLSKSQKLICQETCATLEYSRSNQKKSQCRFDFAVSKLEKFQITVLYFNMVDSD